MNSKIFLIVALLIVLFALTAFAGNRDTSFDLEATISASLDPIVQPHIQTIHVQPVSAVEHVDLEIVGHKQWVREHVGMMPLNVFRWPFDVVKAEVGYSDVLLKPKIVQIIEGSDERALNAFDGLGGNHYARADV